MAIKFNQFNSQFSKSVVLLSLAALPVITPTLAFADNGKKLYDERCASCHGATGHGDGPVGAALPADQKPRNFATPWKFATTDDKFVELLKKGGMGVGLSALMPAQPDLSDADIKSIMQYVYSLKSAK